MESNLKNSLVEYFEALEAFNKDPNRFKSSRVPEPSRKVFDRFFKAREDLYVVSASSTNQIAQAWAKAHKAAEECPQLMLDHKHTEASERMAVLKRAEAQLYTLLREKSDGTF